MNTPVSARFAILIVAGLFFGWPGTGRADEAAWRRSIDIGQAANRRGDHAQAAQQFENALKAAEDFGESDPRLATSLGLTAEAYRILGRLTEAEPLLKRALAIRERILGRAHTSTQLTRHNLATLQRAMDAPAPSPPSAQVLPQAEIAPLKEPARPVGIAIAGAKEPAPRGEFVEPKPKPTASPVEVVELKPTLVPPPAPVIEAREPEPPPVRIAEPKPKSAAPPVEVVELKPTPVPPPAPVIEARKPEPPPVRIAEPKPKPPAPPPPAPVVELKPAAPPAPAETRRSRLVRQIALLAAGARSAGEMQSAASKAFDLVQLARTRFDVDRGERDPAPRAAVQALLAPDEALVSYLVDEPASYLIAMRRDRAALFALDIGRERLGASVKRLRAQLDPSSHRSARALPAAFPADLAHQLFRSILAPADALIDDASHLLIVPDDALHGLPFAVLVTGLSDPSRTAWLARRHSLSVLPAETALPALRRAGRAAGGGRAFAGFGDPLLRGEDERAASIRGLARLPESRYVLDAMAAILQANPRDVYLEAEATESAVKRLDLADYRVLAFATYALMAGEFRDSNEPALVLTPPRAGSELDDGLLTASEVARLKLDADLVVLSAASTAGADGTPGVGGLPRMAGAFLHAGARSLLVSHWAVREDSTLKLVSRMLRERARGAGNAEALQRSMLALMNGEDRVAYTHPMYWAPFAVVGEGGRRTARN